MKKRNRIISLALIGCILLSTLLLGCGKVDAGVDVGVDAKWLKYDIEIEGASTTSDNPWGVTAGIIDVDGAGNCALLTPNTSFTIKGLDSDSIVSLQVRIHQWVSESSDGLGIDVWIMDDIGNIISQDSVSVSNEDEWVNIQYLLKNSPNSTRIKFICNNGGGDDNCDWAIFKMSENYLSSFGECGYVKSITYFGDEWPINFWNSEMENLDSDFQQIVDDGFNSIIICIPWKEFQTGVNPIEYNDYPFDNLDKVMRTAEKYNLDVYTRIGYYWDYYNDSNEDITERYLDILRTEETHNAWLDYCKTLYVCLDSYTNFKGGFLTWEDFWGCHTICDNDEQTRIDYAISIGYQDWIEKNYLLNDYNARYGCEYNAYSEIPIPQKSDPELEAYYIFYDDYLNCILSETQEVFPNMSIEVRMDADVVYDKDGQMSFFYHYSTYSCEDSDYTATMYGIPMGFDNVGERVSAQEALEHTSYILGMLLQNNDGKPVYIEQFLFADNTPQFSYNAQIKDEEIGLYLETVSNVLLEYTRGYGIWTYRDYKNNMIYNSQFALDNIGWRYTGEPEWGMSSAYSSRTCILHEDDSIMQSIPLIRDHYPMGEYIFEFEIIDTSGADIELTIGSVEKQINVTSLGKYTVAIPANDSFDLEIHMISGFAEIDNICLYSFIQEGHLYDENNNAIEYIENIRYLNDELNN